MIRRVLTTGILIALVAGPAGAESPLTKSIGDGKVAPVLDPMPDRFRNPWPRELEAEFHDRANRVLDEIMKMHVGGNTYFENEKRTYGYLMMQVLGGNEKALKTLQGRDAQAGSWHKHTLGIDWYACFTIKHQVRKYFYFGELLDPAYRKKMKKAADIWTEKDPLGRPHHAYKKGQPGWGPNAKNSWVDVRGTDNLWWMRTAAVYLMAEETGNTETAAKYKELIRRHVVALYRVGMGEWDSENYHGHSITPVAGLYDFAKDPEVKLLAKAALDWFAAAGAVKYRRGGFNGPTKRDYNHPYPLGGSAASTLWFWFGDYPAEEIELESDEVHLWTSHYRPPVAVVNLARKTFDKPVEILAAKPDYGSSKKGKTDIGPSFRETQYIGRTFQFGTLVRGTGRGDVNGFKILTDNGDHGVDYIVPAPIGDPKRTGSPKYGSGTWEPARVAQYRNLAIYLTGKPGAPWLWVLPKDIEVETAEGVLLLEAEKTWLAFHPLGITTPAVDAKLTEKINWRVKGDEKIPQWPDHQVISAKAGGDSRYSGFAVEIGEKATHGDYAAFKKAVLDKARLDASKLADGRVTYASATGTSVGLAFGPTLEETEVRRNGKLHDWADHRVLYDQVGAEPEEALIHQPWRGDGTLRVKAGGATFRCTVAEDGTVTFENHLPGE